jgi:uncharacterized Ntn-hydrolase superfamily protein
MLRRALLVVLCLLIQAQTTAATWSIVVVDRRTGEVAVGAATCLARIDLKAGLPTVVPGVGAGVVQAAGSRTDLVPMTEGLRVGLTPAEILPLVLAADPAPPVLQTGIVSLVPGAPVSFTGNLCGKARGGLVGEAGDLAYAIQGNVLANLDVVRDAERALLATPGDLSQKLMAAMEAARKIGGDGRCSCPGGSANCGVPTGFRKSAHCGFMIVARIGDDAPPCRDGADCAAGVFFMTLNVADRNAEPSDPDPVEQLAGRYAAWRSGRAGRPDAILSKVDAPHSLPADGRTRRSVTVALADIEGAVLTSGGAGVVVAPLGGARLHARLGPVLDLGDGRYRFDLTATDAVGTDRLVITARDDGRVVTLYPYLEVRSEPPAALHAGIDRISASGGGTVPFVIDRPDFAGAAWWLLVSAGDPAPGNPPGAGPLAPARRRWAGPFSRRVPAGTLDSGGRAEPELEVPSGALVELIGRRLSWTAALASSSRVCSTNAVTLDIVP